MVDVQKKYLYQSLRILIPGLLIISCVMVAHAQKQGIQGEVFWLSGNQMPGPGHVSSPQQGIVREVYIYKITRMQDVEQTNNFFTNIKTELVTQTFSKTDGSFKVKLLPGEYSVFVKEPNGLFANLFDGEGRINPVVVKPKKYSWITITVDYEAVY